MRGKLTEGEGRGWRWEKLIQKGKYYKGVARACRGWGKVKEVARSEVCGQNGATMKRRGE